MYELTKLLFDINNIPPSLIIGIVCAIVLVIIAAWFITRPPKDPVTKSAVKAHLIGVGNGLLELIDNTLSFQIEKGFFRKRKKTVRSILTVNIKSMIRIENELWISWRGITDVFILNESEMKGTVFEMIPQTSREQKRVLKVKEAIKLEQNEIITLINIGMETIDQLFDILWSMHKWIDWVHIEYLLKKSVKTAEKLTEQKDYSLKMDFTKLSTIIEKRQSEEISKETYHLLRFLYDFFNELTTDNDSLKQIYYHAKTTISAYYLINDVKLGLMVGDNVEKEINALVASLESLSKNAGLKFNVNALKENVDKRGTKQQKESIIEETRTIFRKQIEFFNERQRQKIDSSRLITPLYPPKRSLSGYTKKILKFVRTGLVPRIKLFFRKIIVRTKKLKQMRTKS